MHPERVMPERDADVAMLDRVIKMRAKITRKVE